MGEAAIRLRSSLLGQRARGFTLIEVLVVVAIVGILAAIALPSYADYVRRSKIIEATRGLSDMRTRMEQYFLDNRTYTGGCAVVTPMVSANVKTFTLTCAETVGPPVGFTGTATGKAAEGMGSFGYTITQGNVQATTGTGPWGKTSGTCWVTRKDGSCT